MSTILEARNISKIYPNGVIALKNVSFHLDKGEIHAVLGENGAGKTTLMKIIAGILRPTKGELILYGDKVRFNSPIDALRMGVGMMQQHLTLINNMTVLENFLIRATFNSKNIFVNKKDIKNNLRKKFEKFNVDIPLDMPINYFSASEKQLIEIIFLLSLNIRILILDEPTSALGGIESKTLLSILERVKEEGKSVIFVTHKIEEALRVADKITVLKNGEHIYTVNKNEIDKETLIKTIVGEKKLINSNYIDVRKKDKENVDKPILRVVNISIYDDTGRLKLDNVSFDVYPGEIFGIGGVQGNGQKELVEVITGIKQPKKGVVYVNDRVIKSPYDYIESGGRYIPVDRVRRGVCPKFNIVINSNVRNIVLKRNIFSGIGLLHPEKAYEYSRKVTSLLRMVYPSLESPVEYLSGGNIQKLIVARETSEASSIVVAEEPTSGLDIRATAEMHNIIKNMKNRGLAVLLVSSDLDELLKLCDKVGILYNGKIVKIFRPGELELSKIGKLMLEGKC